MNLQTKLAVAAAALVIVTVVVLGVVTYGGSRHALQESLLREKENDTQGIAMRVERKLVAMRGDVLFLRDAPPIDGLFRARDGGGFDRLGNSEYEAWERRLQEIFMALLQNRPDYWELSLLDAAGQEMVRVHRQEEAGVVSIAAEPKNYAGHTFFDAGMQAVEQSVYISPLNLYREKGRVVQPWQPVLRLATPVLDAEGRRRGLVVMLVYGNAIFDETRVAEGNVYLVDEEGYFLKHPDPSKTFGFDLGHDHGLEATHSGLMQSLATQEHMAEYAVGPDGTDVIRGIRQVRYAGLQASRFWSIAYDMPAAPALGPLDRLRNSFIWSGIIIVLMGAGLGFLWARRFTRPVSNLSVVARRVADNDLTVEVAGDPRDDEVGMLMDAFRRMVESLRQVSLEVREGVNVLASSASEILAASSQVAATASETAAAVMQTSSTVEEVRQTAEVSSSKAESMSERAQEAARVAQEGREAVQKAVEGLEGIKAQVQEAAGATLILSEKSQTIGEIITTVNDLAEQSNLLAVNAAIEAARAGEQGKGFSVVAHEVKSLAEQSKQATSQVRAILNDIQKAVGAAVMATEECGKAVVTGAQQAQRAGTAINSLADGVEASTHTALHIAASSRQQLAGMEQVAHAMENIREASEQNAAGTRQTEEAAQKLNELGGRLQKLAARYQL